MPPCLKPLPGDFFRHAIPTAERVSGLATHIDKHCTTCGVVENDSHLFFLCHFSHQVWDHSALLPFIHLIDPTHDGIQHILPHFLPLNATD
jgi:hypothetical protein